jgi:cyclopropane fatty-acyl-phospholipid synthase-like methyltransferase
MSRGSLDRDYFQAIYGANPDPWNFEGSAYERDKYHATLGTLRRPLYRRAFEPGCSNGVLTEMLAGRCRELLAADVVPSAVERAQDRCRAHPNVTVEVMDVPSRLPAPGFDLIVLSEVGYYWSSADLDRFLRWSTLALDDGGDLVLVHWTGPTDYPATADEVHEAALSMREFTPVVSRRTDRYRMDLLTRQSR